MSDSMPGCAAGPLFDLTEKVALVTGGAGLLGPQLAGALLDLGARVVLADRDLERASSAVELLLRDRSDRSCRAVALDVASENSVVDRVQEIDRTEGCIDVLINCAAFTTRTLSEGYYARFEEYPVEVWEQVMAVNLTGTFLCCREVGSLMARHGAGSIVNIASTYGVVSPDQRIYDGLTIGQPAPYSVSKAGVLGLTRYLSTYWAKAGVRVNAITPGGMYDDHDEVFVERYAQRAPLGRMGKPAELRGAVAYLASDASSYCTGHNLVVDGGWTVW